MDGSVGSEKALHHRLHPQHPGGSQVTVLEEDPVSVLHGCRNHLLSHRTLSLSQRDGVDPVCGVGRECVERRGVWECGEWKWESGSVVSECMERMCRVGVWV